MPHVKILSQTYPATAARHFVSKLKLMQKNFSVGLSKGALSTDSKTWPGTAELSFLHVIGVIWPTSDMNHHVVTPARLLMASYLGLGKIRDLQDIASGMYICTLLLRFERLSRRLFPEIISFFINSILYLAPHEFKNIREFSIFPCPDFNLVLRASLEADTNANTISFEDRKPTLSELFFQHNNKVKQNKFDLLRICFQLISHFAELYKGLDGFIELFEPVLSILDGLITKKMPSPLQVSPFVDCFIHSYAPKVRT